MKFLVLATRRPGSVMPQDPKAYQATMAWIERALESGLLDCIYQRPSGGGVSICNANTSEEIWDALVSYPLTQMFDWTIEPLIDVGYVLNKSVESFK